MPKSQYFCNFQEFRTMFKEMIGKDIKEYEMVRRIELGKITPYLNYKGVAHFTKNAMPINGVDYITDLFEEEIDISGIFRLSSDSIFLSEFCIEAKLGVGNPVAISQSLTESSGINSENALRSLGYCLYHKTNKINRRYSESELKCDLVFLKTDLLDIVNEYKKEQRCEDLEILLEEANKKIESLQKNRNLLHIENTQLKRKLDGDSCKNESINKNTRSQDYKIIAMMAFLLSENSSKYKVADRPNASAINNEILNLINTLQIDSEHTNGLKSCHRRITDCCNELSQFFFTDPNSQK